MKFRVSKNSVLTAGLCLISALGLSGLGFARSVDWDENALQGATFPQMFGPQIPDLISSDPAILSIPETRNYELAETKFSYLGDLDVSTFVDWSDQTSAQEIEKTEIDDTVLRLAYAQYLVSLLAAEDALGEDASAEQVSAPIRQIELATSDFGSLHADEPVELTRVVSIVQPAQTLPVFMGFVPPNPHVRGQSVGVANAENIEQFVSVSVEKLFSTSEQFALTPMPVPANLRPVLVVHPESVLIVQSARDVSLDRLVHVQAQGSWPRRLDLINSVEDDNIFMQDWGRNGPKNGSSLRRLPNGFVLVSTNK